MGGDSGICPPEHTSTGFCEPFSLRRGAGACQGMAIPASCQHHSPLFRTFGTIYGTGLTGGHFRQSYHRCPSRSPGGRTWLGAAHHRCGLYPVSGIEMEESTGLLIDQVASFVRTMTLPGSPAISSSTHLSSHHRPMLHTCPASQTLMTLPENEPLLRGAIGQTRVSGDQLPQIRPIDRFLHQLLPHRVLPDIGTGICKGITLITAQNMVMRLTLQAVRSQQQGQLLT